MKEIIIDGNKIEISNESYNELKKSLIKENSKRFKPEDGERYWFSSGNNVSYYHWCNDNLDNLLYNTNNCFRKKSEAKKAKKIRELFKKYSYDFSRAEWEDADISKYYIYYDFDNKEIRYRFDSNNFSNYYFKDGDVQETLNYILENGLEENYLKYICNIY